MKTISLASDDATFSEQERQLIGLRAFYPDTQDFPAAASCEETEFRTLAGLRLPVENFDCVIDRIPEFASPSMSALRCKSQEEARAIAFGLVSRGWDHAVIVDGAEVIY